MARDEKEYVGYVTSYSLLSYQYSLFFAILCYFVYAVTCKFCGKVYTEGKVVG